VEWTQLAADRISDGQLWQL